ncbi:uncharacterized protein LOC111625488 [Centruroides sculpturatus]|uniref:uncharacterized protein LOC111625488 n=1 Tax=Centruroides sculpturatus TaxID=218467 RepID=UPI000C6CCA26|nr:uncharacterized protein LOC111625488 [Centruroides sculpturatus]
MEEQVSSESNMAATTESGSVPIITGFMGMIPYFANASTDTLEIHRFFMTLENVAELAKWEESVKISVLQARLKGEPLSIFFDLKEQGVNDYSRFKGALIKCFNRKERAQNYLSLLVNVAQKREELVCNYAIRVNSLFSKAAIRNAKLGSLQDELVKDSFIKGLVPELRKSVMQRHPQTLEEAIELAEAEEEVELVCRKRSLVSEVSVTVNQEPSQVEQKSKIDKLELKVDQLSESFKSMYELVKENQSQRIDRVERRRCFTCGNVGHLAKFCTRQRPLN